MNIKNIVPFITFFSSCVFAVENNYHQKPLGAVGSSDVQLVGHMISKVRLGMDFALRFQALDHKNDNPAEPLTDLSPGFSNANGNANMDFQLDKGISSYIELYLSSEHHTEMWMREGYLFIDSLEMLNNPQIDGIMKYVSFKAGQMEINYGDYHFRRTDNGQAVRNPFIGNYIIDANTTEIGIETMLDYQNWEALIGVSGGTTKGDQNEKHGLGTYAKLAYDFTPTQDHRFRISGSAYHVDHSGNPKTPPGASQSYLYSGNRSGSPYKSLFDVRTDAGQVLPNTSQDVLAYVFNLLWQVDKIEVFLNYDRVLDKDPDGDDSSVKELEEWAQYAIDLKYSFTPKFYSAIRYNMADHIKALNNSSDEKVHRYQAAMGYYLNPSILMKFEYVYQSYEGFQDKFKDGSFRGLVFEGAVHF